MTYPRLMNVALMAILYLPPIFNPISPTTGFESSATNCLWQNQWRSKDCREASTTLHRSSDKVLQIEMDGQLLTASQAQQLLLRQK